MLQLVVATRNSGKLREIQKMLPGWELLTLDQAGFTDVIPEPYDTFEQNALQKASVVYRATGLACFADDSGICVEALDGAPGVHSAEYSGMRDDEKNRNKLLGALKGNTGNRRAYFKAVICLMWGGEPYFFEGACKGRIAQEAAGHGGFGYDPVFIPDGYDTTFGELEEEIKNKISHRAVAIGKLVAFLSGRS